MEPQRRELYRYITRTGRDIFVEWLNALKDSKGRAVIRKRLDRVEDGNSGDHAYVGNGIWELRIHYGPGYRIYYGEHGDAVILLLCAGDKSSQNKDIQKAREYWEDYKRRFI